MIDVLSNPYLFSAFLGVIHGVDPARGWLFVAFTHAHTRSLGRTAAVFTAIAAAHAASMATVVLPLVRVARDYAWLFGIAMVLLGLLSAKGVHLATPSPRMGIPYVSALAFAYGIVHGGGIALAPIICGVNVGAALAVHVYAMASTMLLMAIIVYKFLGFVALRRIWLNYDLVWGTILVALGAYLLTTAKF